MGEVSVSFNRAGQGWVDVVLSVGDDGFLLDWVSHTTDVVGDVVRAAAQVAAGGFAAEARFDREPVELRMLLERRWEGDPQQQVFRIRILELPNYYADASSDCGEERFCATCDPIVFASAVHVAAARLLGEADSHGNLQWWDLPFPFRAFAALGGALAEKRAEGR
jgi:hypothetical protein